jgi:hypothetical protein
MKLLSADTLKYQKESTVQVINKIFIYKQIGTILGIFAGNRIKVSGIHSGISLKTLIFPYKNINISASVIGASFNTDYNYTDITLAYSMSFGIDDIGSIVCEEYPVSDRLIRDGIDAGEKNVEGNNLFEFDSGNLEVTLDNKDGFLINKNKTGLFDSRNVFWIKYLIKFKKTNEEINWFTGIIDLTELEPDLLNKTVKVLAFGNSYELSRYPAYKLSQSDSKYIPKIGGINLVKFYPSENTQEGIKSISYKPFTTSNLTDSIQIESVSNRIPESGIKLLEYRYPNQFRWDGGNWRSIKSIQNTDADSSYESGYSGKVVLYGQDNTKSWVTVILGDGEKLNEFPTEDGEIWVQIKKDVNLIGKNNVGEFGKPILIYDDGTEHQITINFQEFLKFTASTQDYTPVTLFYSSANWILQNNNDAVVVISPTKFWGIIIDKIYVPGEMTFEISYSVGGKLFSTPMTYAINGLVDETEDLTKAGMIYWNKADNWIENNLPDTEGTVGVDTTFYKGYMIKIKRVSGTSGVLIKNVTRPIRLKGSDGDFLEVSVNQDELMTHDADDEIIVKKNKTGEYEISTWYENVSLQHLLDMSISESNYSNDNKIVRNMLFQKTDYSFNIWGKVPRFNMPKNVSAFTVDTANNYIYIGVGLEVWKSSIFGSWEKVFSIDFDNDADYKKYVIEEMWISESVLVGNILYVVYTYNLEDGVTTHQKLKKMLSYKIESEELTYHDNSLTRIIDGKYSYRVGNIITADDGAGFVRQLGVRTYGYNNSYFKTTSGENLSIPFKQVITLGSDWFTGLYGVRIFPAQGGIDDYTSGVSEWMFYPEDFYPNDNDVTGRYFIAKNGHYMLQSIGDESNNLLLRELKVRFTFGQSGIQIKEAQNYYIFSEFTTDFNEIRWSVVLKNLYNSSNTKIVYPNLNHIPHCMIKQDDTIYSGITMWRDYPAFEDNDTTQNFTVSFSYITKINFNGSYNWDKVFTYADNLVPQFSDVTSNANSSTLISPCLGRLNSCLYFGKQKKFRSIYFETSSSINNYGLIVEYWNGEEWAVTADDSFKCISADSSIKTVSFDIPGSWQKCSVNGSSNYYYVRIRRTVANSESLPSVGLLHGNCFEEIIWDSEVYDSGSLKRYSPIWMVYDSYNNAIHGCMFNRETFNDQYPFQWCYFVLDLDNNQVYIKRNGDNFDYDPTYLIKDFVKNDNTKDIYCTFENIRFEEKSGFLAKASYDKITHEISLISLGTPYENDYGSAYNLFAHNGDVYGITKGNSGNKLWEYKKDFSPRIELAKFESGDSLFSVFNYIAQISNSVLNVTSDRKFIFQKRGSNELNNLIDLEWDKNLNISQPKIGYWKHLYDSVVVEYNNLFIDDFSGQRKKGNDGWLKNVLNISNPLIQNNHIAKILADELYLFFNIMRYEPENFLINFMPQLECLDDFHLILPSKIVDANNSTKFILTSIKYNQDMTFEIKGLEKI